VAHCLTRLVFCLFAEDVSTLPEGLFGRLVDRSVGDPERFPARVRELFAAMVYGARWGVSRGHERSHRGIPRGKCS
jgi:restriction-modification enzyme MmeI-like protein